jgi:hypothetical protein
MFGILEDWPEKHKVGSSTRFGFQVCFGATLFH